MGKIFILSLVFIFSWQGLTASLEGQRILIQSILANDVSAVKQALGYRFDINEKSEQGHYAIHMALRKEVKDEILELILKAGAQPDVKNKEGRTSLHLAVLSNSSKKVELLIKAKANPSIGDRAGYTPLMLASLRFSPAFSMVRELLEAGADTSAIALGRFTALDFAQGMLEYFKKYPQTYSHALTEQEKIVAIISGWSASSTIEKAN